MATRTRSRTTERQQPQSRVAALREAARETAVEMKKINWPDRDTTRNLTIFVIGLSVVLGLLLGGVDGVFVKLWELIPTF
jgi:preprotein translocase subunit SecE